MNNVKGIIEPPFLIAGPCSAESRDQVLETAAGLKAIGITNLRAGLWKPRSRANHFEGVGADGLEWLQEVKVRYEMKVATEVATPSHVELALNAGIDIVWIGARTTVNPFQMQELAEALRGVYTPVLVKNPVCPDLELWIGAVERLLYSDVKNISVIHRGFCTYNKSEYRNEPLWDLAEQIKKHFPELPLYCDPSHISGKRELLEKVIRKAVMLNYDGLFVESHCCPDKALSDKQQQVTPSELGELLHTAICPGIIRNS